MFFCNPNGHFIKALACSLLIIVILPGCLSKKKDVREQQLQALDLLSLVSVQLPGWKEEKSMLISEAEDIVRYMGDEAELYFAYRVQRLAMKKYKNDKSLPMLVEVYEFDSSESAYGIYSFDTVGKKMGIGQEGVYGHGLLKFWKDKMLVRVIAQEEFSELESDIFAFGRAIDSMILTTGSKPQLLSLISEKALVPDSITFFYKNICLNNIHYIPESAALFLSEQTKAATALYALGGKEPTRLLLIEYPDETEARVAFGKFGEMYYQEDFVLADETNIIKMDTGGYDAISLKRNFVVLVFDAQNADICRKMMIATLTKIEFYGEPAGKKPR